MAGRILIVDDEPAILKYLVMRLAHKGYEIITATDGEAAVERVKREKPDLLLLDVKLPKLSGYEVFHKLRNDPELKHIPVIFSTADATIGMKGGDEYQYPEASDYILKPFEAEELYQKVSRHLAAAHH